MAQELFTIENGLLTANGKLRRDIIAARFAAEIERMYAKQE
jgi:long-subunit acyl-CoA synthetase (AMP-forming)